jgi:hypothetical protein
MAIKLRLGDLLVKDGLIKESDLRTMLAQQKQHGGRLGEHLVRVNLCTEEQIAQALARQINVPFTDLTDPPAAAMTKLIPREKAVKLQALALGNNPFAQRVPVAIADPTDIKNIQEVEKVVGHPIVVHVASAITLRRAIEAAYFSIDVRDEGTSEFQITDVRGGARSVKVGSRMQAPRVEEEVPELSDSDMEPLTGEAVEEEEPPVPSQIPRRFSPSGAPPTRAAPAAAAPSDSGEEALRMVWSLADLLIERGYFSRSELMKALREK